jgi:hypothetical protein
MCYRDGPFPAHDMTYGCPQLAGVMNQAYDCGGDDYFNVAPAPGSYLATHWDVYDSSFMASCATIAPACSGTTAPLALPVSTALPQLSGSAQVGGSLGVSTGAWTNAPSGYAYRWERGDGLGWAPVAGATGPVYLPSAADVGGRVRATVIATNQDGSSSATSAPSEPVAAAPGDTGVDAAAETAPSRPGAGVPVPAPAAAGLLGSAAHRLARGGRRLGTVRFSLAGGRLRAQASKLRLARGRYALSLCTVRPGEATRCRTRRFALARAGRVRPPALTVALPEGGGRASVSLAGRGFAARTAKRPTLGVLVGRP